MSVIASLQNDYVFPVRLNRDTYAFALIRERIYSEYFFQVLQKYAEQLAMHIRAIRDFKESRMDIWKIVQSHPDFCHIST
jgi:hypothetical protein